MEDFDVFTDEISYTKPFYTNLLNKYVKDAPPTPNGPNYQCGRKLLAEECLKSQNDTECAFHLSEAVSATLRTLAVYRDEQIKNSGNKMSKITNYIKPVGDIAEKASIPKEHQDILAALSVNTDEITETLKQFSVQDEMPFWKKYLKFGPHNNVENFQKILKDVPEEWTIVQITAPYNPNENLKPLTEYQTEIDSIYVSVFTNDYFDETVGPITVNIPANETKEGEIPLFTELHALIEDNYKTIDNAQFLNNKRYVQNYWKKREDIDLRMKSVLILMDTEWLGGWGSILTGRVRDRNLRDKIVKLVDNTARDWGFFKLTNKQKVLLYNLIESCPNLTSSQIKPCIRKILTEHGDIEILRKNLQICSTCTKEFELPNELCIQCLSKAFEKYHHFTLVDGIRAFSSAAKTVKECYEWEGLKNAKRYPVILIVDEILDTFPWESLPILQRHPVCRMENIHFTYYLYKMHQERFQHGYFMADSEVGRYVINPEKNLDRMENRMRSFVEYWCSSWRGHVGEPPSPDDYLQYLAAADIFLYCGHGDGCRLAGGAGGAGVEAASSHALALLAGCASVRLRRAPGRTAPGAAHHALHIAHSPMVVGMLWEVTDLEVDKVVSAVLARAVPSGAPDWPSVGKAGWSRGVLDIPSDLKDRPQTDVERDLLMAISKARGSTNYVMIASSIVARGLPVRIKDL